MKSQPQQQELFPVAKNPQPDAGLGQPSDGETSRIGAAISRILLISRVTAQSAPAAAPAPLAAAGGEPAGRAGGQAAKRDATPVEWALRMMF